MGDNIDLQEILKTYTKHWTWFVLSVVVMMILGTIYLRYSPNIYESNAKIKIIEDKNGGIDLFKELEIFSLSKSNVLDEIEIIKSRSHLYELTERLGLNTKISRLGDIMDTEVYDNPPFILNFVAEDSIINRSDYHFEIEILSETSYSFQDEDMKEEKKYDFGNPIKTLLGDLVITPNTESFRFGMGQKYRIDVSPFESVAEWLKEEIKVVEIDKKSNIVSLSFEDPTAKKANEILEQLISIYNENAVLDKKAIADKTSNFINSRIADISSNLTNVDESAESLRTSKGIVDISSQANINLTAGASNRQELAGAQNQLNIASGMLEYVDSQSGFEVLPSNLGLSDPSIGTTTARYNQLVQERNRLLQSSNEQNPVIKNLDGQLSALVSTMKASLNSTVNNLTLTVNTLSGQQAVINSKIYSAPRNERALRDITRKQQTTETLYLYLLQKREEAQIAAVSAAPKSKMVDFPSTGRLPVSPKKQLIWMASFIVGLLIPMGIIYINDILDDKVVNMKNLEEITEDVPVIGELPRLTKRQVRKAVLNDRTVLGESLRIIRTNIDYLIKAKTTSSDDRKRNVVFITSSVSGEGKTFVSTSIALILAAAKKKVLLVGADIRNPKISNRFYEIQSDLKEKNTDSNRLKGITDFLVDDQINWRSLVHRIDQNDNNIDIVFSGRIPPNPAELLLKDKLGTLFEEASRDYDYVIVDTAPMMPVTDTLLIAKYSDLLIYVTRANYTENKAVKYPIKLQEENKISGLCFVVNDVANTNLGYGGMYGYGYKREVKKWWKLG